MFYKREIDFSVEEVRVYLRKSRFDDPLLSVDEVLAKHDAMLDDTAERLFGEKVSEKNKLREVVSGETIKARPEMQKLLRMIESPDVKAILTVEVQRLSRGDLEDAGRLIKLLRFTNTLVITPQKIYDLQDEYDRDAFERELKRGNEYLEYTKKIMGNGRLLSVSQGNFIGSIAPYGYDKNVIIEGRKKYPTLKINEQEAETVRMIFDMYVNEDLGMVTIAHRLNALGIKPRKSELWSTAAIKDILYNVHYIGKVKWNWRKIVVVVEDGEINKSRPKNGDFYLFEGRHPAIIDDETFQRAQEKQGKNHRAKGTTKIINPFATLVYCQCGRAMTYRTYKKDGKERCSPRLLCDNQAYCHTSSVEFGDMMDKVIDVLESCVGDFEIRLENNDNSALERHTALIKRLESKLEELKKKEISQWEKYSEEGMPKHIFNALNEKVQKEKEETKQALKEAHESTPDATNYEEKICRFKNAIEALKDPSVPPEQKNRLLRTCIERIDYTREKSNRWCQAPFEIDVKLKV